jgi:outer membrane usher protein FimD/PapC
MSVALIGGTTSASAALAFNAQTGTTYTFVLADADNKLVTANANVAFPIGTQINLIQLGAGQVTVNAVTSGTTTIVSTGATAASPKCRAQYSAMTLIKRDTDSWYAIGDIA